METLRLVNSKFRDAADEFFYRSIGHWNGVGFGEWARRCRVVAFSEHAKYVQSITLHLDGGNPDTPRMMTEQHASQVKEIFAKLPALREVRFSSGAFHVFQGPFISDLARCLAIEYLEDVQAFPMLHTLELTFVPKFKTTVPGTSGFIRKLSNLTALTLAWDEANANDEEATVSNMKEILEAARNVTKLHLHNIWNGYLRDVQCPLQAIHSELLRTLRLERFDLDGSRWLNVIKKASNIEEMHLEYIKLQGPSWEDIFVAMNKCLRLRRLENFQLRYHHDHPHCYKMRGPWPERGAWVNFRAEYFYSRRGYDYHAYGDLLRALMKRKLFVEDHQDDCYHSRCGRDLCSLDEAEYPEKVGKVLKVPNYRVDRQDD